MSSNKEIGDRLLIIRNMLGLSQDQIADRIGISRVLYNEYENGKSPISKKSVEKIKRTLNINDSWLLNNLGDMYISYPEQNPENQIAEEQSEEYLSDEMFTRKAILDLIEQNKLLVKQVSKMINMQSDMVGMQKVNADSINNFSKLFSKGIEGHDTG